MSSGRAPWVAGVAALFLAGAAPPPPSGFTLLSPLAQTCISSPFGPRGGAMHQGVDLAAPAGAWVRAAAAGTVLGIGRRGAAGLVVQLRHADGSRTRYAHLGSVTPALAQGRRQVAAGERLGRVGRTGTSRGTHLHFELYLDGQPVDAAPFLALPRCGQPPG